MRDLPARYGKALSRGDAISNPLTVCLEHVKSITCLEIRTELKMSHLKDPFPVPDPTLPLWRIQLHELDDHRSTEELPTECDVLIIGAGYSGVTTAYHLLDDNPSPPSVVILEARQACSGATGRNGIYHSASGHVEVFQLTNDRRSCQTRSLFQHPELFSKVRGRKRSQIRKIRSRERLSCQRSCREREHRL